MNANLNLDVVKEFALDVWHDLRERGMAGIAVGMAVALVAISAIVMRPADSPDQSASYALATPAATENVRLSVPGDEPLKLSDIDLSAPRDPFRTVGASEAGSGDEAISVLSDTVDETTTASTGGGGAGAPAVSYDESDALVPLDQIDTAGGNQRSLSPATPAPEAHGELAPQKRKPSSPVTDYSYAADLQFGKVGALKRYRSVQRLGFVPSRGEPLLMYVGVKPDRTTAVFMVDSRLSQGGEGRCVPRPSLCTFLELSATAERDEHRFRDADDNEYLLRVLDVVRTTAAAGSIGGPGLSALPGTPDVIDGSR